MANLISRYIKQSRYTKPTRYSKPSRYNAPSRYTQGVSFNTSLMLASSGISPNFAQDFNRQSLKGVIPTTEGTKYNTMYATLPIGIKIGLIQFPQIPRFGADIGGGLPIFIFSGLSFIF